MQGRIKRRESILDGRYYTTAKFIGDIRKHHVCHRSWNGRGIFALLLVIWLFLNIGNLVLLFPNYNFFKFNKELTLRSPFGSKYLSAISIPYSSNIAVTIGFYAWYAPLLLTNLNKLSDKLFPHSEKAKLVRDVILDDKDLPDNYKGIWQINNKQVLVDYSGHSLNGQIFLAKRDKIAGGVKCNDLGIDASEAGYVLITFGKMPEWKQDGRRLVLERENGKHKAEERPLYVYAVRTYRILPNGNNEIKIGKTVDPKKTLSTYGRINSNPKFILLVRATETFNENTIHNALEDFYVSPADGRLGEFYEECEKSLLILRNMLLSVPENILEESILPEGIADLT